MTVFVPPSPTKGGSLIIASPRSASATAASDFAAAESGVNTVASGTCACRLLLERASGLAALFAGPTGAVVCAGGAGVAETGELDGTFLAAAAAGGIVWAWLEVKLHASAQPKASRPSLDKGNDC